MEIEYRWFSVAQSQSLINDKDLSPEIKDILQTALKSAKNTTPNDLIALLALNDKTIAGRILFTYGHISTPASNIRIAAAQKLLTNSGFRGQGIGSNLISKSLEIGMPCFYSGISNQAIQLYTRLGFSFIDQSPIYQMPIGTKGILREWRNRLGRASTTRRIKFQSIRALRETLSTRKAALKIAAASTLTILNKGLACSATKELMGHRHNYFQVPWNKAEMVKSANNENSKFKLLVFRNTCTTQLPSHFVNVYKKTDHVRLPRSSKKLEFMNGIVNEIYPPPTTLEVAIDILSTLTDNAKAMGFDNLSIYAMTPVIENACQAMGLNTYHRKSIAFQPANMKDDLTTLVLKPKNWWCRAVNEDYIEEAK